MLKRNGCNLLITHVNCHVSKFIHSIFYCIVINLLNQNLFMFYSSDAFTAADAVSDLSQKIISINRANVCDGAVHGFKCAYDS